MARHGENIRKRKDGRWEGRYYTCEPHSGRKTVHSVYAQTYSAVKEKLLTAKAMAETAQKEKHEFENITFYMVALEWLESVDQTQKHATYIKYRSIYEKYFAETLNPMLITSIDDAILTEVFRQIEKRKISESLKKSIACVWNQILNYAESHYHTGYCKCTYRTAREKSKPVKVMNRTEQIKLFKYLYDEIDIYKVGIIICISTGLRLGEICSLKWSDIDLQEKVLHVNTTVQRVAIDGRSERTALIEGKPKSVYSQREIPLSEELVNLLTAYYNVSETYVINQNNPMEPRTYQNKFQKYLKEAGIEKKNFHVLRHTFATNCISSGTDIKSLSEILGHSDVKITLNRYVHPTLETKRQHMNSLSLIYGQIMGQF